MTRWIGFLRAVNVGGRKVPTAPLQAALTELGLDQVGSYLASGNVFFTSRATSAAPLERKIEAALVAEFGFEVPVLLRTEQQLAACLAAAPFPAAKPEGDIRRLVIFVRPAVDLSALPVELPKGAGVIHGATGGEVFVEMVVGERVPNPASVVEREYGVVATGRFLHTLHRIAEAARSS